jgi:hypothetical protein
MKIAKAWFGLILVSLLTGCGTDPDDICEDLCEIAERCGGESCSSADKDACVDEAEKLSDDCQSAYGDYVSCMNDVDSCDQAEAVSECGSEAGDFLEACGDELGDFETE